MLPKRQLFLSRVTYVAEKRAIVAEFSTLSDKVSLRYSFFPRLHFPLEKISKEKFREAVAGFDGKHFKVDFRKGVAEVFAATFSDLKKLNKFLTVAFGFSSNLIEPERQFLIAKKWNYFDLFEFSEREPTPLHSFEFPDIHLDFISEPLKKTVSDLLVSNKPLSADLVKRIAYSRLLRIPLVGREDEISHEQVFMENIFFASAVPIHLGVKGPETKKIHFRGKAEIDLSRIVSLMSSQPLSNIGVESINCDCCKPQTLSDKNVLTSSLVNVKFLQEGFYFNSVSPLWANDYHSSHTLKDEREQRRREYFYNFYPVGPFARNQEELILLSDALILQGQDEVEILQDVKLNWFCTRAESSLSSELNLLKNSVSFLNSALDKEQSMMVASKGLFFSLAMDSNPDHHYRKSIAKGISTLLSAAPRLLSDQKSRFFNKNAGVALEVLSGSIMRDFEELVVSTNGTPRNSGSFSSICVDSRSLMSVLKRFSQEYKVDSGLITLKQP